MKSNTVVVLQDVRIGNGNYMQREFRLPDGGLTRGPSARLFFPDDSSRIVGEGSVFTVKGVRYEVVEVLDKHLTFRQTD